MAIFISILCESIVALLIPDLVLLVKPALQPAIAVTMLFVGMLVPPEHVRMPRIPRRENKIEC